MASSGLVLNPTDVEPFPSGYNRGCCRELSSRVEVMKIFLATLGCNSTVFPMFVLSSDTVATVKMRIQAQNGLYTKQQRLVYGGRELKEDDRNLIKDCGVCDGEVVHVVVRVAVLVDVKVATVTGEQYLFQVPRNQRVKYVKERISEKERGLAVDDQYLVFNGERLDDEKRILDLDVDENVLIHLMVMKAVTVPSGIAGNGKESSVNGTNVDKYVDKRYPRNIDGESLPAPIDLGGDVPPGKASKLIDVPRLSRPRYDRSVRNDVLEEPLLIEPVRDFVVTETPDVLLKILQQVRSGFRVGHAPILSSEGSGGTYFMRDSVGSRVGVFKPVDEEPEAVNNPRNSPRSNSTEGLKSGIRVGEGAMREVAAYLLDHPLNGYRTANSRNQEGLAGVPPTMMVRASHKAFNYSSGGGKTKVGSLQQYVQSVSNCEDMGPANFPVDEVHKISVLDLRLANTDRNGGNILVCKQGESSAVKLVPIDHGYSIPDKFEDCTFEWLYWPQARVPFSETLLKYIAELDADRDISILGFHGVVLRPKCARVLRVATMLLKKGAAAGLTPFAIGSMMSRERFDVKSAIETMLETAEANVSLAASEDLFMDTLSGIMDQYM